MQTLKALSTPIVNERRFILATRDTGYRSTAAAVAELVDNAIQATASIVRIFVKQEGAGVERQVSIAVLDNGSGMDPETLAIAMQFAGSSRFNDRTGLGRFGMGLPNSSVSQARRVDVYTWQERSQIYHTYLDVDEVSRGEMRSVPRPKITELPGWSEKHAKRRSGTLIEWSRCDRLDNRKASTIAEKLFRPLGQRFRYYLCAGNRIYINDVPVEPFDPLFINVASGLSAATPFGEVLTLEFHKPSDPTITSTVRVRFSELPIGKWYGLSVDEKRELGVPKGAGVSIVRANREIDFGWYFMGAKRKENYDDWWRCEVAFDPDLDELFGVTHSKQEINPINVLRLELSSHLESIAQTLNSRARAAFLLARQRAEDSSPGAPAKAAERDRNLPPVTAVTISAPSGNRRAKAIALVSRRRIKYRIKTEPLTLPDAFVWDSNIRGDVTLTVNENHSLYERVFSEPLCKDEVGSRQTLEFVLLALARAYLSTADTSAVALLRDFHKAFSNILAAYLGD